MEFLCYLVYELRFTLFPVYFRLMATIFDFRHTRTSYSIPASLYVLPDPENLGIAVEISLLSRLKAETCVIFDLLPVLSRHIGYLVGVTLVLTPPPCSPAISRKSQ